MDILPIQLTDTGATPIYVNAMSIMYAQTNLSVGKDRVTTISFRDSENTVEVTETPKEIYEMIQDAPMAMAKKLMGEGGLLGGLLD